MKKLLTLLVLLLSIGVPVTSYAQAASGSVAPSQVMAPDDMAKLKAQIDQLSKAMGNTPPVTSATPPTPAPTTSAAPVENKTMATVADKALDMVGGAVATLSSNLQKVAPYVWRIMIKQQYAKAVNGIIVPLGLLFATVVFTLVMRKLWDPKAILIEEAVSSHNKGDVEIAKYIFRSVVPGALIAIFTLWFFIDLGDSIKLLINPEYYAIKDILQMVTNPASVTQ